MKLAFRQSFVRDLKNIRDKNVLEKVQQAIDQAGTAGDLSQIGNVKKLVGTEGRFYRMRIGEFRVGLCLNGDVLEFVRCLHRQEIYRYFP